MVSGTTTWREGGVPILGPISQPRFLLNRGPKLTIYLDAVDETGRESMGYGVATRPWRTRRAPCQSQQRGASRSFPFVCINGQVACCPTGYEVLFCTLANVR